MKDCENRSNDIPTSLGELVQCLVDLRVFFRSDRGTLANLDCTIEKLRESSGDVIDVLRDVFEQQVDPSTHQRFMLRFARVETAVLGVIKNLVLKGLSATRDILRREANEGEVNENPISDVQSDVQDSIEQSL